MSNPNYVKGRKKEYKLLHQYKKLGFIAIRSAGSHSPIDIIAINPISHRIKLLQSKPDTMPEKQKEKIEKENEVLNGVFEVSFKVV